MPWSVPTKGSHTTIVAPPERSSAVKRKPARPLTALKTLCETATKHKYNSIKNRLFIEIKLMVEKYVDKDIFHTKVCEGYHLILHWGNSFFYSYYIYVFCSIKFYYYLLKFDHGKKTVWEYAPGYFFFIFLYLDPPLLLA